MVKQTGLTASKPSANRFIASFAWALLIYNLLVILWGVYVRATGSGAGCGGHWPTCNGQIIPTSAQMSTMIEFIHRVTSGLTLVLSFVFVLWAWRVFPKGNRVRLYSALVLGFTLMEAIIGAGLVLFGLVASNDSVARAIAISLHLVNTLLLIGSLTMAAWWISNSSLRHSVKRATAVFPDRRKILIFLAISLAGMLILGVTGTVTALGDTLFPSSSLVEGLKQDISPLSSFLIRLRVIHPVLAVTFIAFSAGLVFWIRSKPGSSNASKLANPLLMALLCQLALGASNILLLAPVWLQLVHLLVADLVWILLVLFSAQILEREVEKTSTQ